MKVNNKIPWGLATGALGITTVGIFNGTAILGMGSFVVGALALVATLLARQQLEKKKLKPELALKLR
jgi:hypothetical protein